jgi:hypothetical protein
MTREPMRWAECADAPELSELMRAGQSRLPSDAQLAALLSRVQLAALAVPTTAAGVGAASAAPKPLLLAIKPALTALGLGVAGAGAVRIAAWLVLASPAPAPLPRVPSNAPLVTSARAAPQASPVEVAPAPVAAPPSAPSVPRPVLSTVEKPASELSLIRDARSALAGDPARAMRLVEQHSRTFPDGALSQEREVIAVEALAKLGQSQAARARAEAFVKAHRESAYAPRLERAVGRLAPDEQDSSGVSPAPQK